MEVTVERGFGALGTLFQNVITDLKVGMPLWEDFIAKATKLHTQLKSTIVATTSYLDSFQKIADLATNARGATKEIGKALTRIILRHKAVEARLKTFTSSILDCLILPLQDKVEEWKKTITQLDKDHAKEHKKALQEIKKRSSDTMRLQKKVRKGKCEIQRTLNSALQDTTHKFIMLEEAEKNSVRMAFVEERSHFCLLVACLKPVVDEEVAMMGEITHLQEILEQLMKNTSDPFSLPPATEQIINDVKGLENSLSLQTPPSSPSSVGSRKSSVCSMSSLNSSSSGSTKSRSSPSHHLRNKIEPRFVSAGPFRLSSVSSQDSGFTSQDTLFLRPPTPPPLELARQVFTANDRMSPDTSSTLSSPSSLCAGVTTATWPNLQDANAILISERPHTISTAYEKGHQRPALSVLTFEPLAANAKNTYQHFQSTIDIPEKKVPQSMWMPKLGHASSLGSVALPDFNRTPPNQVIPLPIPCANSTDNCESQVNIMDSNEDFKQSFHSKKSIDTLSIAEQNESSDDSSKYCTMPRYSDNQVVRSPVLKGYSTVGRSNTLRAISSHAQKPPLPIRRTSSISSQHGLLAIADQGRISNCSTLPRKLRETSANISTFGKRMPVDTISSDLKAALENRKRLIEEDEKAEEIKEENEEKTNEEPVAPPIDTKNNAKKTIQQPKEIACEVTTNIATKPVLSRAPEALIEANLRSSPRSSSPRMGSLARRKSEPGRYQTLDERMKRDVSPKIKLSLPHESPVNTVGIQQNNQHFLHSLNAKLAEHVQKQMPERVKPTTQMGIAAAEQNANRRKSAGDAGSRWQQKLAERPIVDPSACRESLLDQIRKGTSLRQAKSNDRSLPHLK